MDLDEEAGTYVPPSDPGRAVGHPPALTELLLVPGLSAVRLHEVVLLLAVKVPTQTPHVPPIDVW